MMSLPLSGVRVIDFSQVMLGPSCTQMLGPSCTQMLGDYGAEVIKIEKEKIGDLSRWSLGVDADGQRNPVFSSLNRNKKSVAVNLKSEEARARVLELLSTADVVVNNFRPRVMERMGFGYEDLKRLNPRLIYAVGTGFGTKGPNCRKGGQDILAQALSGVMERKADPDHPTAIYPTALCDYSAGMHLVQGVLLALLQRDKTGEGQIVSVSLYDSMLAMQMQEAAVRMMRGRELNWARFPLTGVFQTTDRPIVMVGAFKVNPLRDICEALQIEDLSQQERFCDFERQMENRAELQRVFRENFATNSSAHWLQRLETVDILCAPVRTLSEALDDEQTAVNGMLVEAGKTPNGPVRVVGSPISMSAAPLEVRHPPPSLGEHNAHFLEPLPAARAETAA